MGRRCCQTAVVYRRTGLSNNVVHLSWTDWRFGLYREKEVEFLSCNMVMMMLMLFKKKICMYSVGI